VAAQLSDHRRDVGSQLGQPGGDLGEARVDDVQTRPEGVRGGTDRLLGLRRRSTV
jgi:hypothetical protein